MKVSRIDLQILGERNFPLATARINAEQAKDFPTLLDAAVKLNPATTPEDVVRAIWRHGCRRVNNILATRHPINTDELPNAMRTPAAQRAAEWRAAAKEAQAVAQAVPDGSTD